MGTIGTLSSRNTATLVMNGNNIALNIGGTSIYWTGAGSNDWATGLSNNNWKQTSNNAATNFLNYDEVVFDDNGSAQPTVNISGAAVTAPKVLFNNSSVAYTLSGNGIAYGAVTKSNSGTLTINTANTYTNGTRFSGGTLNLGNAAALGNGALAINAGSAKSLDNTSGGAMTLATVTSQAWNDNFTFIGTNDLNMGTGAVTLGGSRSISVSAGKLTVGGVISDGGSAFGLTKGGSGTLTLTVNSTYTGGTVVNGGILELGSGGGTGTIRGPLTINNGGTVRSIVTERARLQRRRPSGYGHGKRRRHVRQFPRRQ